MITDDTNSNTSTSIESACLPIGCAVSAKYRGAFCSAQVKTVDRQVKIKVTLIDTGETTVVSENEILHSAPLRLGNRVTIRLVNSRHDHYEKKQATIKQIYDNSIYTVVFNDGDEKSLRRSSLCLQGIRLYQTKIGQQKFLEDIPTSSLQEEKTSCQQSIVAIQRLQQTFPALILQRKSLADYIWIRSFLDGREYIVHKHNDVKSFQNNSQIQSLCRLTSKQATKACEKYMKYNQIPLIWQKKKPKRYIQNNDDDDDDDDEDRQSTSSESDVDNSDDETAQEKDSFVAQLYAFMDDRGTPINNIPKIQNYDLDLHRLFKIVRLYGGFNKVKKNNYWSKVYIKMGLPDEATSKNCRAIESAYEKYLFAYEDLSKKLGSMSGPNAYLGGRTSLSRSLLRLRQQSDEKKSSTTSHSRKRLSIDTKPSTTITRRKPIRIQSVLTSSDSDSSDHESMIINNKLQKTTKIRHSIRSHSAPVKKSKSVSETEETMKPVIKIPKLSYEILMESTSSMKRDLTPLPIVPASPSTTSESSHSTRSNRRISNDNSSTLSSRKRSHENSLDEQYSPAKRSRRSFSSQDSIRLTYNDIFPNDNLLVKFNSNETKQTICKCLEKNPINKQILVRSKGINQWIDIDRILQRQEDLDEEIIINSTEDQDSVWKSILTEENAPSPSKLQLQEEFSTSDSFQHQSIPINEEVIDNSSTSALVEIRRNSNRQPKRRTFRQTTVNVMKKKIRFDNDLNSNESIQQSDLSPNGNEQQGEVKRLRTVGKRQTKRSSTQQDNESEDYSSVIPLNSTLRQQLDEMFKDRTSRYNFLDLNNNLTGDKRLAHLKDRMRQCQKVFLNLKSALTKIEKQRRLFLRRQKLLAQPPPTNDLFL